MPTLQYTDQEKQILADFVVRKKQLKDARTNWEIESIWKQADADYLPHELGITKGKKKVLVENERTESSSYVNLAKDAWRSKVAKNDPYIKIQTALSIMLDRNPEAVFTPAAPRFESSTELMQALYHHTWADTKNGSRKELSKFVFNLSKYGWSLARRYYRKDERKDLNVIKSYNPQTKGFEYEKKDKVDMDDVYFENVSVWDAWIDDMALPDLPLSRRDWMWRVVMSKDCASRKFGEMKNFDAVQFSSLNGGQSENNEKKQYTSDDLAEFYYYENREKDLFICESGGVLLFAIPLPREDKELSLVDTYWTLRSTDCPYGLGLNELMRGNKVLLDRVRNMTVDQVVLSIYKMFFYSNAEQLDDEGGENISVEPGRGKKVIDPKNINWLNVPGPGRDAYEMIKMLESDIDDDTGVTKTLQGELTGKTAFEIAQAQQGALKRLGIPLRNIKSALEWDAFLTINLMKTVYSVPKIHRIVDPDLVSAYIAEIKDDKDLYFVDDEGALNALEYRQFQLSLEKNENDEFVGGENNQFFMVKPKWMEWEGTINIRIESMIEVSKPLEREQKLQMSNILLPLIGQMAANPMLVSVYMKPVKQILKIYDEQPKDWLPQEWLIQSEVQSPVPQMGMQQPELPGEQPETMQGATNPQMPEPQRVVPSAQMPQAPTAQSIISRST